MTLEGPLNKWTNHFHGWQYRYFILDVNRGLLSYYLFKEHIQKGEIRGCIRLNEAFVGYDKDDDILFTITVGDETFHLQASNLAEKEKWVSHIEKAIILSHTRATSADRDESRITQEEIIASADKFDSTVTELDAYLQLLIEQSKSMEDRYNALKISADAQIDSDNMKTEILSNDLEGDDSSKNYAGPYISNNSNLFPASGQTTNDSLVEEKKNVESFLASTKTLIETIKHSIVCLQIAKVNCDPRNGLHTNTDLEQVLSFFNNNTKGSNIKQSSNHDLSNSHINSSGSQLVSEANVLKKKLNNMLEISFNTFTTSDDDEAKSDQKQDSDEYNYRVTDEDNESFYDAVSSDGENEIPELVDEKNNEQALITTSPNLQETDDDKSDLKDEKIKNNTHVLKKEGSFKLISDDEDDEFEEEEIDVNSQSSVITHLLTQVRIGMDLTKITLPTFILETRSLLEMYADFFAATELFLKIPDIKDPHERMIQAVRWYMSTFRAGRKSPVAKKPYNPVLGEIFQCWYNFPTSSTNEKKIIKDGPVPWASNDQVTFVAEQVSHHPPISAFYAEHVDKRVQVEGYTWTKSSFLGLSIAVHMVGKAVLTLLDLDEEYSVTFPSAYGRSILGVPWFEMGGQVQIDCLKTGYQSTIQFLTKPFYGGKKHQITGTICGPDKKVLNTLYGDWNGTMFLKTEQKIEIFLNTQTMPIIRKKVRKLKEQCEYESRKIWKDVTYNLRSKQLDLATKEKQNIEQRQRDGVKKRKEENKKMGKSLFSISR